MTKFSVSMITFIKNRIASIVESDSKLMNWSDNTNFTIDVIVLKERDYFGAIVSLIKSLCDNAVSSSQISHSSPFYIWTL